jgi:hypothetical protein
MELPSYGVYSPMYEEEICTFSDLLCEQLFAHITFVGIQANVCFSFDSGFPLVYVLAFGDMEGLFFSSLSSVVKSSASKLIKVNILLFLV